MLNQSYLNILNNNKQVNDFNKGGLNHLSSVYFVGRLLNPLLDHNKVLDIFKNEIVPIPRSSGNCSAISDYLAQQLKECGFKVDQQQHGAGKGNIIATRNVDNTKKDAIILQAHMDMVYATKVKNRSKVGKDEKLPVVPVINGKYLMAKNTSLGADDGIGVAIALGIARIKDPKIAKLPLQIIFTVDEEVGLIGAKDLSPDVCKGRYLIGLDNANSNNIMTGCAGITEFHVSKKVPSLNLQSLLDGDYRKLIVKIDNAIGGHSALAINRGGINPVVEMIKVLNQYNDDIKIATIKGGKELNSIPTSCEAEIYVEENKLPGLIDRLNTAMDQIKLNNIKNEAGLQVKVISDEAAKFENVQILSSEFQHKFLDAISNKLKVGTIAIEEGRNRPTTSQNLGYIDLSNGVLNIKSRIRSNDKQQAIEQKLEVEKLLSGLYGCDVKSAFETPVWEPKDSQFTALAAKTYEDINDQPPHFSNTHGTVEGSLFDSKVDGQINIGPTVKDLHTTSERMLIDTLEPVCNIVETLIQKVHKLLIKSDRVA